MRARVTKTAWFGPKVHVGWGWSIRSWQGWLATAVLVALPIAASAHDGHAHPVLIVVVVVAFLLVLVLTGDPPGGPANDSSTGPRGHDGDATR